MACSSPDVFIYLIAWFSRVKGLDVFSEPHYKISFAVQNSKTNIHIIHFSPIFSRFLFRCNDIEINDKKRVLIAYQVCL
jgi:hypothetical protein